MIQSIKAIDLNKILKVTSFGLLILLWYSYSKHGDGLYVDLTTVLLGTALSIQIVTFLFFERKRRDPFVLLLCLQMTVYFLLRIVTLLNYEFSNVFTRFPFTANDLNHALVFILVANQVFYFGLTINGLRPNILSATLTIRPVKTYLVVVFIGIGYFFAFYQKVGLGFLEGIMGMVQSLFVNLGTMLFMAIVFLILFKGRIDSKTKRIVFAGILLMVLIQTLTGSRSAILSIVNYLIFASLAIHDCIKVEKKYLVLGSILLPIMIIIFALSTFLRPRLENRETIGSETFEVMKEFDVNEVVVEGSDLVLMGVFDRIGFLDYCAETISNSDKYSGIFNPWYYFKSIVDNILTPGFTVFDTPRVSNATTFVYNERGTPSLARVGEGYQSDEFTMFGEFYALFGKWFSLIPIFFTGYFFKSIYLNINQSNIYLFYLKRALILFVFYSTLNSFGLDWVLLDVVAIFFTYKIFKRFFKFQHIDKV
ncbi:hypothetical protein [Flavobacterium cerinum]|uniref:Oligosaccharide repeat unit polymerase n=1 Tax=Flavobacterium cerinum TaxID=2502784 RepID=A0A444HDS1_9FLAO|nr:hypothetical protein [Flavobacterium cerinum]RWX02395.1 hypothetical protein EPI11_04000 [Flavobacterium cerinum]